ncbi:DMT family transporter [Thalassotalea euphylliae]|uniref:DMT family transporter n=1 Tax=Thalassotalea euphylliae TaxID=1655234 RepID=A0A3E0U5E2_9GAMM|nr:DMT family transporter [Thalassotalea euphylliae]REL32166.1 DMT family transporter [Thalassotalea euphylliae]
MKTAFYTLLALCAFAGNSILCRLALGENTIDAASFTNIRLVSGIATLMMIYAFINLTNKSANKVTERVAQDSNTHPQKLASLKSTTGTWWAAAMLFTYAVTFSYAYVTLDTGTGALILFATVQLTLIMVGLITGNRLNALEWLGLLLAFSGFVYLILPTLSTPSLMGFILMSISGVAWGLYTLAGRQSMNPLADTSFNFLRTLPFVIVLLALTIAHADISAQGVGYAVLSGAVASGLGYTIWYKALPSLSAIQAGVVQLLVPILAAVGGVIFADENLSMRLIIASLTILGGILLVMSSKHLIALSIGKPSKQD